MVTLYTLYFLKTLRQPLRNAVLAGLFFALAALTEMTFATFLALLSLVILLASWRWLRQRRAVLGRLALAAAVGLLHRTPVLVPIAREFVAGGYGVRLGRKPDAQRRLTGVCHADESQPHDRPATCHSDRGSSGRCCGIWCHDRPLAPMAGRIASGCRGQGSLRDTTRCSWGHITLALALLGAVLPATRRQAGAWSWSALLFGLLTLGPLLQIGGRYQFSLDNLLPSGITLPLPFVLLHYVPFFNANRAPNRFSLILMLALALLAAFGAWWLMIGLQTRLKSRTEQATRLPGRSHARAIVPILSIVLVGAVIVESPRRAPLPTTDAAVPDIYRLLAGRARGIQASFSCPWGGETATGRWAARTPNCSITEAISGKPIIGGNISRAPAFKMAYFRPHTAVSCPHGPGVVCDQCPLTWTPQRELSLALWRPCTISATLLLFRRCPVDIHIRTPGSAYRDTL